MTLETFLLWVAVGAIAGFLASLAGSVAVAFVGAVVLLLLFRAARSGRPRRT